jgi:NAD+ synthase
MMVDHVFSSDVLDIDPEKEVAKISKRLRDVMVNRLKRRGVIIGLSGGIDSSVTTAVAVNAFGQARVLALLMPERHSAHETLTLSRMVADHFGVESIHEDISGILEAVGFYRRYDEAVRLVIPEYGEGWKSKIVTPNVTKTKGFN